MRGGDVAALVAALVLAGVSAAQASSNEPHEFIGWLGERDTRTPGDGTTPHVEVLSWQPKIFLGKGILTDAECDELIQLATPRLTRSGVSDSETGEGKLSDIRTSYGMFFARGETPLIRKVEERLARWIMVPVSHGEGIQVLRYGDGQEYRPHHDYFSHAHADENGGNRLVTILMYLSDVDAGGETVFPKVKPPANQTREAGFSECAMKGLAYKPRKGDAIAFWSINSDGRFEPASLHGSCPVIKGSRPKFSATKWVHIAPYGLGGEATREVHRIIYVPPPPPAPAGCVNKHSLCQHWAESGECSDNPSFMVGSKQSPGACLLACNRCDLGPNA